MSIITKKKTTETYIQSLKNRPQNTENNCIRVVKHFTKFVKESQNLTSKNLQEIIELQDSCCFYCEEKRDSFAQDHFLPWNYLFQTEQYNMVPACQRCNSSKNERLLYKTILRKS